MLRSREDTTIPVGTLRDLDTRVSLRRGRSLRPGIKPQKWHWHDLLDGPPPRRREVGDATHITFHTTAEDDDVRISFTTIIHVSPGLDPVSTLDDTIHIDERVYVQRRALHEIIDKQRAFTDRLAIRQRERMRERTQRRRDLAARSPRPLRAPIRAYSRVEQKCTDVYIRSLRGTLRACVNVPDKVLGSIEGAGTRLGSKTGRRHMWAAMRDPSRATAHEKSVLLLLAAGILVVSILALNSLFALVLTGEAPIYTRLLADFSASLLGVLALPIPAEPLLVAEAIAVGSILAFTGLFLGKIVGSWMLYLIGDSLNAALEKAGKKRKRIGAMLDWLKRNANRRGFLLLTVINAVPLMPDVLVYPFAVSGMRIRGFMGGIALGTVIKFVAILVALQYVGQDRVIAFFTNPFG